jgi:8-oxo-dGTP pyrophosphatase MutT (NUDIX family)
MSSRFEQTSSETAYEGKLATVYRRSYRHEDGEEVQREVVAHRGAVAVVAHDGEQLYLVRQPREAVGIPDLLELPAGKLDEEGEEPLATAQRELAEEIGKAAEDWELLTTMFTSPGFTDEVVHIYLATGLSDRRAEIEENERIDVVAHPLRELDALIDEAQDSKTLVGLYALRRRLA